MKNFCSFFLTYALLILMSTPLYSQFISTGIGTDTPDSSAVLDLYSTNQGFLTTRLDSASRVAIANPANGLLVFDTDHNHFYYWNGIQWIPIPQQTFPYNISFSFQPSTQMLSLTDGGGVLNVDLSSLVDVEPAGIIHAYAGQVVPTGWLHCDGAPVSRTVYSDLFNAIGTAWGSGDGSTTFNLPDLRGRFLRGVDDGSNHDPEASTRSAIQPGGNTGDNVGSYQEDAFQGHWHNILYPNTGAVGGNLSIYLSTNTGVPNILVNKATNPVNDGSNGTPRIALETRPDNAYVKYIIKY